MARTQSRTHTAIWSDPAFRSLTANAQRVYWMLYSQSTVSLCGVLALTVKRWAANASDTTIEDITAALKELEECEFIVTDSDTEEVFIRTFARHDGVGNSPKTRHAAYRQLAGIASADIRALALQALQELGDGPDDMPETAKPQVDTLSSDSADTLSSGPGDTLGVRVRAVSSLRLQSPDSSLPPHHAATGTCATHGDRRPTHASYSQQLELAKRVAAVCTGKDRRTVNNESAALVSWACESLDPKIIEEAAHWAEKQDQAPALPRALGVVILAKARDLGIAMRAFTPPR